MHRQFFTRNVVMFMVAALLMATFAPAYAQDESGPDSAEGHAPTEIVAEVNTTFQLEEAPLAPAAAKAVTQPDAKVAPTGGETGTPANDIKIAFLPQIRGSFNVANAEAAAAPAPAEAPAEVAMEGPVRTPVEGAAANGSWYTMAAVDFDWHNNKLAMYDCNGTYGGRQYWGFVSERKFNGLTSAWPARAGVNRVSSYSYYYPNNACAWMIYGPFSLQNALLADLRFQLWSQTETDYDFFHWLGSCDGSNFFGLSTTGDTAGWRQKTLYLDRCAGDSTVWVAFKFTSDSSFVDDGSYVDAVRIYEYR